MRRISRRVLPAVLVAIATSVGACGGGSDEADEGAASKEKVLTIGAAVSQSGALFEPGSRVKEGYQFWADTVNAAGGLTVGKDRYQVKLVMLDDKSDPTTAAQVAQRLISEDKVDFMFGPYSSDLTIAVGAIADRNGVIIIAPGGNADDIYKQGYTHLFGIIPKASELPGFWLEAMLAQTPKPTTLGLLVSNDAFAQSQRGGLKSDAEAAGVKIVVDEVYSPEQQDFSTVVSKLRKSNPDSLAVLGHTEDSALIVRQMKDQQYYPPNGVLYTGPAMLDFQTLLKDDSDMSFGLTFWDPVMGWKGEGEFKDAETYASEFEAKFGKPPSYQNATASASGTVLQIAMERAGSVDPEAVRKELLAGEIPTFEGLVKYDETGLNSGGRVGVQQIADGKVAIIYPDEIAQQDPVYPTPGWSDR